MGRAKREQKKTINWGNVLLLICFIVVAVTFFMLHDLKGKADKIKEQKSANLVQTENTVKEEEAVGNISSEENVIQENVITENLTQENTTNIVDNKTNQVSKKSNTTNQAPYTPAETNDKEKAINLVKKEWGEDNSVSFSFEYINENGEYVISVREKSSATVKNYFRVDINKGTVELD